MFSTTKHSSSRFPSSGGRSRRGPPKRSAWTASSAPHTPASSVPSNGASWASSRSVASSSATGGKRPRDKVRDKIIAEKKRLDENYRLLSYFSKFVHADAARSIAKKQIGANRERIEEYEEEEANLAEEEWALMED